MTIQAQAVEPHLFVVFGATGDLMRRKLLPALARLYCRYDMTEKARILGVATSDLDDAGFRALAREALEAAGLDDEVVRSWCDENLAYHRITDDADAYRRLAERISALESAAGLPGNRVFYLAVPPQVFPVAIEGLGEAGLAEGPGWTRLVIEKPFGRDLASARELNELVHRWFDERQVYRIDHYLGKETVQNLLVFRFANSLFESSWNRDRIEAVQITVAETVGVGGRVGYYDGVGALRDMIQNHLTQVLCLIAMEPPVRLTADAIRDEKVKVLEAVEPPTKDDAAYGQYTAGEIDGELVPGYVDELGRPSTTETAAAVRLRIDNWRWQGVPFYLRTGKRFPRRVTQVVVRFRQPPVWLFEGHAEGEEGEHATTHPDVLVMTLQPDEGFDLLVDVKEPGEPLRLRTIALRFRYEEEFGELPGAYETLLYDVLIGDQTLFVRADEVEHAWRVYQRLLDEPPPVDPYPAGTWGPPSMEELPARDGYPWLVL